MTTSETSSTRTTCDGFIGHADGSFENGLTTTHSARGSIDARNYDVIIVGAGLAGLVAARELSQRGRSVAIVEAKDRIGGRAFTAKIDDGNYEIGGTWIHWSQPHIWSEMTRYGFSIIESEGADSDRIDLLLDQGRRRKTIPTADFEPKLFELINAFNDVDGMLGRTVFPRPHAPLTAFEVVRKYEGLTMQDRLNQISGDFADDDDDMRQILDAYLSMNTQGNLAESGFLDHLCFWALGDYETSQTWDKTSRYKIREGTSALAQAIFNDCQGVDLLLSTPIASIHRADDGTVQMHTRAGQVLTGLAAIITVPLNALHNVDFQPALGSEKQRAIGEGQCRGGTKFWVKLEQPIGNWCGFAAYPSPITVAYTDDREGAMIVGFGPDDALDIRDVKVVERELQKFLPECKVQYVFGHDWRRDEFVQGTWSWYRAGQISANLRVLQTPEPPLFFASSDAASSWRGCMDGALESGLTSVRHVQQYLRERSV